MPAASDEPHAPWNIKGMPVDARRRAVEAASADGQTVAAFLAEAVALLIDKRAGRYIVPTQVEPPTPLTPDQLTQRMMAAAALQQSMAALKAAGGRASGRGTLRLALASLEQRIAEAEGVPVRAVSGGQLIPLSAPAASRPRSSLAGAG